MTSSGFGQPTPSHPGTSDYAYEMGIGIVKRESHQVHGKAHIPDKEISIAADTAYPVNEDRSTHYGDRHVTTSEPVHPYYSSEAPIVWDQPDNPLGAGFPKVTQTIKREIYHTSTFGNNFSGEQNVSLSDAGLVDIAPTFASRINATDQYSSETQDAHENPGNFKNIINQTGKALKKPGTSEFYNLTTFDYDKYACVGGALANPPAQVIQPFSENRNNEFTSSEDSSLDTLVIDQREEEEEEEEEERRPSVIKQADGPMNAKQIKMGGNAIESSSSGVGQQQGWQKWPMNTGSRMTTFEQANLCSDMHGTDEHIYKVDENRTPMCSNACGYQVTQDGSEVERNSNWNDNSKQPESGPNLGCSIKQLGNTLDFGTTSNNVAWNESTSAASNLEWLLDEQNAVRWDPMCLQSSTDAMAKDGIGCHKAQAIQRLASNFANFNSMVQPVGLGLTSNDMASEALASIGLFPYPCNDPNCPGEISGRFQEFPFPRKKTIHRSLHSEYLDEISPVRSSFERIIPDAYDIEPNQDEQRLLLRRMRNREAAKRCRKKKKEELITLLLKRAMLLVEYHKYYHIHSQPCTTLVNNGTIPAQVGHITHRTDIIEPNYNAL